VSKRLKSISIAAALAALTVPAISLSSSPATAAAAGSSASDCPWMNTSQSAGVRAHELMSAMTLQQKMRWLDEQAANNPGQTTFGTVTYPAQVPCTPTMAYADGPWEVTGVSGITTGFPVPVEQTGCDGLILEGPAFHSAAIPDPRPMPAPDLGQDTIDIGRDLLGLADEEIAALVKDGIFEVDPPAGTPAGGGGSGLVPTAVLAREEDGT